MSKFDFDDGTIIEKDISKSSIIVNDPNNSKFEISGFQDEKEMDNFCLLGDFSDSKDNNFFIITGSKTKLTWTWL